MCNSINASSMLEVVLRWRHPNRSLRWIVACLKPEMEATLCQGTMCRLIRRSELVIMILFLGRIMNIRNDLYSCNKNEELYQVLIVLPREGLVNEISSCCHKIRRRFTFKISIVIIQMILATMLVFLIFRCPRSFITPPQTSCTSFPRINNNYYCLLYQDLYL